MSLSRILSDDAGVRNFFSSFKSQLTDRNGYPMWRFGIPRLRFPVLVNPLKAEKLVQHLIMSREHKLNEWLGLKGKQGILWHANSA
jgi:hypothetical protein